MSALEWSVAVSGIVGGKAGGKAPTSQGIGTDVASVDKALEVAEKWFSEKFRL